MAEEKSVQEQVDAFVALPRAERRVVYPTLPAEVQRKARKVIEARRGISHRTDGGELVLDKKTYIENILRLQGRVDELPAKKLALESKVEALKKALQEYYGDEALGEAETALEQRGAAANA